MIFLTISLKLVGSVAGLTFLLKICSGSLSLFITTVMWLFLIFLRLCLKCPLVSDWSFCFIRLDLLVLFTFIIPVFSTVIRLALWFLRPLSTMVSVVSLTSLPPSVLSFSPEVSTSPPHSSGTPLFFPNSLFFVDTFLHSISINKR